MVDSTASDSCSHLLAAWDFTTLRGAASQHLAGVISAPSPVLDSVTGRCDPRITTNLGEPLDPSSPCFGSFPSPASRLGAGSNGVGDRVCCWRMEIWSWQTDSISTGVVIVAGRLTILGPGTRVTGLVAAAAQSERHGSAHRGRFR